MIRAIPATLLALGLAMPTALAQEPATPMPGLAEAPAAAPAPQPVQPRRFRSPEEGFAAFAAAVRRHDESALLRVLGEEGRRLIRSGDRVADRAARARFTELYEAGHRIERPAPDRSVLVVGADEWPLPIPMRLSGGAWRFDVRAGAQELLDRRIGRNELDVIDTLRAIADAQAEYAAGPGRQGGCAPIRSASSRRPASATGSTGPQRSAKRGARSGRCSPRPARATMHAVEATRHSPIAATTSAS